MILLLLALLHRVEKERSSVGSGTDFVRGIPSAPALGTGEATPGVLGAVLGPSLQEGPGGAGACPETGSEAGQGAGEQVC